MAQLRAEEREAENLHKEAQISLQQARDAVAEARKDRGYGDGVQQGQPRGPPTFTPGGRGKSKGKGKKEARFGKSSGKGKGKSKGKGKRGFGQACSLC